MALPDALSAFTASLSLIALAEVGDKSQIVCMALAARHRHWPVLLGASAAFLLLNTLAVLFGAGIAAWVDERIVAAAVALLFAVFGIQALLAKPEAQAIEVSEKTGRSVFLTTLSLIFLAEFGDKTQIAVAGLASNMAPLPVWLGATTALIGISAIGVWIGRALLKHVPVFWLQRIGGGIFLLFAGIAAWQAIG